MAQPHYRKAVLDNGVTLIAEQHEHVRSVSIGVWVKVGSTAETPVLNGISHYIEHMVFKGTETRTPLQIATVLESLGGELNAFTDREATCFHATVLNEHIDIALEVLSDLVLRPTFPKAEVDRERKVLLQEMAMLRESPEDTASDLFFSGVWKDQPLGRSIIGTEKSLKGINRSTLLRFYKENYVPENIVVSVAGNFEFELLKERCERFFTFRGKTAKAKVRKAPKQSVYRAKKQWGKFSTDQMHLLIGFEGLGYKDTRRFDALVLSFFLGGGMSSRLFQEVREKNGLAYSVDCDFAPFADTGIFAIFAAIAPKNLGKCLELLRVQLARVKEELLTEAELAQVKGQLKGMILMSADVMDVRQESLGRNEIVFGRYISVEEIIEEIHKVTAERINEVANQLLTPEKETVIIVSKAKPVKKEWTVF